MLEKINSGFQTGSDIAGIFAGKIFGFKTGGVMPKGFLTQDGCKPEYAKLFGAVEHSSFKYSPRTFENVKLADATLRLAVKFDTPGEVCTKKAIDQYCKPYLDIDLSKDYDINTFFKFIIDNNVHILNVAGNSEKTYRGMFKLSFKYLSQCFSAMGLKPNINVLKYES